MSKPLGKRSVARILDRLFAEQDLTGAVRFGTQQEGTLLPADTPGHVVEALSGFAIGPDGLVYRFWLAQDPETERLTLNPLAELDDLGVLAHDPEYHAALKTWERTFGDAK